MAESIVHHFSQDPSIVRFEPHVPRTNPDHRPAVWAIDPEPVAVTAMDDLVDAHVQARIELRLVPSLWPLIELVRDGPWDFSCVRLTNALPPDIGPNDPQSARSRPADTVEIR